MLSYQGLVYLADEELDLTSGRISKSGFEIFPWTHLDSRYRWAWRFAVLR